MGELGQWWRRLAGRGPAPEELADAHLLLLPPDVPQEEVAAAVRCRYPDAPVAGRALLLTHPAGDPREGRRRGVVAVPALLHPAVDLSARQAARAGVPAPWRRVLALVVPPQREATPPAAPDRDGLHRAFPDGLPTGTEADGLRLLLALARRFGGAVRVTGSGQVLQPDPLRAVDHLVRTTTWLEPEALLEALGHLLPDAEAARSGDLEELVDAGEDPVAAGGPVPEPYVVSAALDGVDVLLLVHPEEELPVPDAAATATTYEVRWDGSDEERLEEQPGEEHRAERVRAQAVIARVSAAVLDRTGGIVLDEDLLPVVAAGPPPRRGRR